MLWVVALSSLFVAGRYDVLGYVKSTEFHKATESWVFGRLAQSEFQGMFSAQMQLGRFTDPGQRWGNPTHQRLFFEGTIPLRGKYSGYGSQIGLQGQFLSAINGFLGFWGTEKQTRIEIMHTATAAIFAAVLSLILLLLYKEIGWCSMSFAFVGTMLSRFSMAYSTNLYWLWGLMYLPIVVVWWFHQRRCDSEVKPSFALLFGLVGGAVFVKCASGYEFTSTVLMGTLVPLGYFSIIQRWSLRRLVGRCLVVGTAGITGFLVTLGLHMLQLRAALGSFDSGIKYMTGRIRLRTDGVPPGWQLKGMNREAADASIFDVIQKCWSQNLTDLRGILGTDSFGEVTFLHVFWATLICAVILLLAPKFSKVAAARKAVSRGLILATFLAIMAPLSWFVLGKAHAYVHVAQSTALIHMPGSLFCFALLGHFVGLSSSDLRQRIWPPLATTTTTDSLTLSQPAVISDVADNDSGV